MELKNSLKVAGPSAIAAWVFYQLINKYLEFSEVFKTSIILNALLIIVVFLFCFFMGWLWINNQNKKVNKYNKIESNVISDNVVDKDISVSGLSADISKNKVKGNKVKGSINIGGK